MTYAQLYPNAHEFEEVLHLLYKQLVSYCCLACRRDTMWLTYRFYGKPVPVCSPVCMDRLLVAAREKPAV